jgi:hypothetical protein
VGGVGEKGPLAPVYAPTFGGGYFLRALALRAFSKPGGRIEEARATGPHPPPARLNYRSGHKSHSTNLALTAF